MSAKTITVKSVRRETASGDFDTLDLKPGVNVIVGVTHTGKSGWLKTISYLLGDNDIAEHAIGEQLAKKFDTATIQLTVGTEEITLQRRWKEQGAKHKIFANTEGMLSADFGEYIHQKLGIPIVHFPKGNPYSGAAWRILSWRMLFRHIYREERFWSDLADKQPEQEKHACILQFLGVADKMYPKEFGEEVSQRQNLLKLQARKEQFESVLQQAAKDLIPDPAINTAPTLDAIDHGIERLRADIEQLRQRRQAVLENVIAASQNPQQQPVDTALAERRVHLSIQREQAQGDFERSEGRFRELKSYCNSVTEELYRLNRAETANDLFAALRVTQCPVCDRKITPSQSPNCYLCQHPFTAQADEEHAGAKKRLLFEIEQLQGEEVELKELLERLSREQDEIKYRLRRLDEELVEVETLLMPMRTAFVALIPPEVTVIDTQIGQTEEKIAQLLRLRQIVLQRDQLSDEIDQLRAKVEGLSGKVDAEAGNVPFERLSDELSDGINEYLNILNQSDSSHWQHGAIRFNLRESSLKIGVGKEPLSTFGATSIGFVLLGYHYALLKLSGRNGYNYPGIALVDFPITFADQIANHENYLIEPFVKLFQSNPTFQLIVGGRSFESLEGVHRVELATVWKRNENIDSSQTTG